MRRKEILLDRRTACWIRWMLDLRNITYKEVAKESGLTSSTVSEFANGRNSSDRVANALAKVLDYPSFEALLADGREKSRLGEGKGSGAA